MHLPAVHAHHVGVQLLHSQILPHRCTWRHGHRQHHADAAIQPLHLLTHVQILRVRKHPVGRQERMLGRCVQRLARRCLCTMGIRRRLRLFGSARIRISWSGFGRGRHRGQGDIEQVGVVVDEDVRHRLRLALPGGRVLRHQEIAYLQLPGEISVVRVAANLNQPESISHVCWIVKLEEYCCCATTGSQWFNRSSN